MSEYVNKMRDTLVSFNRKALEIGGNMADSRERCSKDYAAEEIANLHLQLNQAAANARDQIDNIHKEAMSAARKWAALDGKEINAADLSLLKGDFKLSVEDINAMVVKYWDNGTMINAIDKCVKRHRVAAYVPNLNDKLQAYGILVKSAHALISNISEKVGMDEDYFADWGKSGNVSDRLERALYGIRKYNTI